MMTPDELERLLAKATPGPWDAHDYAESYAGDRRYQIQERSGEHRRRGDKAAAVLGYFEDEQVPSPEARANARLVAAMRNEFPKIVAKLRAADALSSAVECHDCIGDMHIHEANDAFRKAGEP